MQYKTHPNFEYYLYPDYKDINDITPFNLSYSHNPFMHQKRFGIAPPKYIHQLFLMINSSNNFSNNQHIKTEMNNLMDKIIENFFIILPEKIDRIYHTLYLYDSSYYEVTGRMDRRENNLSPLYFQLIANGCEYNGFSCQHEECRRSSSGTIYCDTCPYAFIDRFKEDKRETIRTFLKDELNNGGLLNLS